ncbi:MAG TPA: N-acetylmuramoyl-L-alanine amidase [Cytophagaceae bacterium]
MARKAIQICLVLLFFVNIAYSQSLKPIGEKNQNYSSYEIETEKQTIYQLEFPQSASSLSMVFPSDSILSTYIIANSDTIHLQIDGHLWAETGRFSSSLIVFNSETEKIEFYSGDISGPIQIHLNHTPSISLVNNYRSMANVPCGQPSIIPVSTWRQGLTAPVNLPECSEVKHVIVHHSATSNALTDYQQIVRDIYVFHTKPVANGGSGFDDIGYNYLIAPDGSVYQGRDAQGVCDDDNVKGAHMCGRNTNTMGICLLGTFMDVKPTTAALSSLYQLIAWKLNKESLSAYGNSWHPVSAPVVLLENIAGHREGCNPGYTVCPGDSVYHHLNTIRDSVNLAMSLCIPMAVEDKETASVAVFPQPANDVVFVQGLAGRALVNLYSSLGEKLKQIETSEPYITIPLQEIPKGVYFIEIKSHETYLYKKIVVE